MNGLAILTEDDFVIQKGSKDAIMCTAIKGLSLILFYSTQCKFCKELVPIFKKLPGNVPGCQFGVINVSLNKRCVIMSRETVSPIDVVPFILLFYDGKPYMRYKGPYDISELSKFVSEVSKTIHNKTQFSNNNNTSNNTNVETSKKRIPEYTIGKPLCGPDDKVCYLDFNIAYNEATKKKNLQRIQ